MRRAHVLFLPVFFASGFAALAYQMVWQRLLTFFCGADIRSVTLIVSAFMAGLGLGNLAGGYLADRLSPRRLIAAFAAAEAAIAAFAFISIPLIHDVLLPRFGGAAWPLPLVWLLLFLVLLWPTFFMGLSLPLLARALTDHAGLSARRIGGLYGWNTLGAASGALLVVWVVVRLYGFAGAVSLGAVLNLGCAASALALLALSRPRTAAPEEASPIASGAPAAVVERGLTLRGWLAVYALSGFVALSLEIVWFRILGTIHKTGTFTFATLLAVYLLGVGGGALLGGRLARRVRRPAAWFFGAQTGIAMYAALSLLLLLAAVDRVSMLAPLWRYLGSYETLNIVDAVRGLVRMPGAVGAPYAHEMGRRLLLLYVVVPAFLIGPPTLLMGLSFSFLQQTVQVDLAHLGRRVGGLQTANIAGSTLGSALTGLLLLRGLGTPGTLRVLVACAGVFALLWARTRFAGRARVLASVVAVALVGATAAVVPAPGWMWARLHGTTPDLILYEEDGSGTVVLKEDLNDQDKPETVVYVDGLGQSGLPFGGYHAVLGALPVLVHPQPQRVLVIGLGSGTTVYSTGARRETWRIDCIEIVQSELGALRQLAAQQRFPGLAALLVNPRLQLTFADGRTFLLRSRDRYDVIEADAVRPGTPYAGSLYSLEYFALLRSRLARGGLAVTWAPTTRVRATFARVFPHVLEVGDTLLGSDEPVPFDADLLRARLADPFVRGYYERAGISPDYLLSTILRSARRAIRPEDDRSALTDVNTDLFPKDEFLSGRRFLKGRDTTP